MIEGHLRVAVRSTRFDPAEQTVFYIVEVASSKGPSLVLRKRYSQFAALHADLVLLMRTSSQVPAIPPKELRPWINQRDPGFIEERRVLLERFLAEVASKNILKNTNPFRQFIATDLEESSRRGSNVSETSEVNPDAEVTEISIPATKDMSDHTLYQIHCANGDPEHRTELNEWVSLKRYTDFFEMDQALRRELGSAAFLLPALPQKENKILKDHGSKNFIQERRVLLQNYLRKMIRIPKVLESDLFLKFLNANF